MPLGYLNLVSVKLIHLCFSGPVIPRILDFEDVPKIWGFPVLTFSVAIVFSYRYAFSFRMMFADIHCFAYNLNWYLQLSDNFRKLFLNWIFSRISWLSWIYWQRAVLLKIFIPSPLLTFSNYTVIQQKWPHHILK